MTKRAIKMRLGDGSVLIEVSPDPAEAPGEARVSRAGVIVTDATKTFEEALDNIPRIANALISKMRSLSDLPDEVGVDFSINLTAGADVIIAKTSVEGAFKIKIKWSHSKAPAS